MSSPTTFTLTSTQTALAFLVPTPLQPEINSLRKIHDKAYHKWQPHINIIYPFVDPSFLPFAISIIRQTLQSSHIHPLDLNTNEVGTFKHRRNATVFLKPSEVEEEAVCELRRELMKALGCVESEGTRDGTFRPHLSIGQAGFQGNSLEKLVDQTGRLKKVAWKGRTLVVLRRREDSVMEVVEEMRVGEEEENEVEGTTLDADFGWNRCFKLNAEKYWEENLSLVESVVAEATNVQIMTYNTMAEPLAPAFNTRFPLIIDGLKSATSGTPLGILNLQEVDDESLPLILGDPYIQECFPFSTHAPTSLLPSHRNLITLASKPFRHHTLEFPERHKAALVVSFDGFKIDVANVHLTSSLTDIAVKSKLSQMNILNEFMGRKDSEDRIAIVAGDFNLTSSSQTIKTALEKGIIKTETQSRLGTIIDPNIWIDTFGISSAVFSDHQEVEFDGEEGATFDRLCNPLAALTDSPIVNRPERYDRVLVQNGRGVEAKAFEVLGLPNEFEKCGSDHYGLSVVLRIPQKASSFDDLGSTEGVSVSRIEVVQDTTDINSLLVEHLPSEEDQQQRLQAISLLETTLKANERTADLILAPLGSYSMDTYFANSDVDILAIGSIPPAAFFDHAASQLKSIDDDGFKGVHFVNSLVSIIEVCILGIKFDLQYCEAPELLTRYYTFQQPNLRYLAFDKELISSLSPSSLRPLNTYRDTAYLLNTIPDMETYQDAHRYLSLYLKRKGLYSAKFGYLGGIHLSLMLNRVVKLLPKTNDNAKISAAALIRTFLDYYAIFNWTEENVTDPTLSAHQTITRSPRDAILIPSIHLPTARKNVASSCTKLTARLLGREFKLASGKTQQGNWEWCHQPGAGDFLHNFGAFIRVDVDIWDVDEIGGDKIREIVGGLESKFTRLLVVLGRVGGLEGQIWPERFRYPEPTNPKPNELKGCYLIGVSARDREELDPQQRRLFSGKVITAMREFENGVKESREFQGGSVWTAMELIPKKKVLEMNLIIDERDWGSTTQRNKDRKTKSAEPSNEENRGTEKTRQHQKAKKSPLRPAQDIISRIHWDESLSTNDYLIGYEDRFVGVKEIELARWKSEQTDEEFIPMHRIVWVRKRDSSGGEKVWDRREKLDLIFGSGVVNI